jgi:hypothetical protein
LSFAYTPLGFILIIYKPLKFYKNTYELFQNYILVPIILRFGH